MTARLTRLDDYREPPDCPYSWGEGYDPCAWHDLPVHRCLIQGGHDGLCLCMCTAEPPAVVPRAQRFRWTGRLDADWVDEDERSTRLTRLARRQRRYARYTRSANHTVSQEPSTLRPNGIRGEES